MDFQDRRDVGGAVRVALLVAVCCPVRQVEEGVALEVRVRGLGVAVNRLGVVVIGPIMASSCDWTCGSVGGASKITRGAVGFARRFW